MTSQIKITFLGTADQIPSASRNHTAVLINYNEENILVDCGEGTQRQFRKAGLNPCKITRILITHWHGDHVLGLPGLFQTLAASGYNKTLYLYGPKGIYHKIAKTLELFGFKKELKLEVKEIVNPGKFLDEKDFYLECENMEHGLPCFAYSFVKKGLVRIDKAKLKKAGLPEGPLLKKIKEGKDIEFNGKKFKAKDLTYSEEDRKVSVVLDTLHNKRISKFVKDADVFICESNFDSELEDKAKEHLHLTAQQAAQIAKEAKVKKLILTHISQRYEKSPKKILEDAKKVFKESVVVKDLDVLSL